MDTIWDILPSPFFILAPMENVTDSVFRRIIAGAAKPDLFFTEFMSTNGYLSEGNDIVAQRILFTEEETPLIAQIWGKSPELFYRVAKDLASRGFAGIDINMGCPDRNIIRQGGGSGLIKNHSLAKEIVLATIEGAGMTPVSVKTRIGLKHIDTENWLGLLLSLPIKALTVHGRTAAEMSKVPVHLDEMAKAVTLRNSINKDIKIVANGDILTRKEGEILAKQYGFDGIMIGRGIFSNLWAFEKEEQEHSLAEHLNLLLSHTDLFEETWGKKKHFLILRKFYKAYVRSFDGASALREALMQTNSFEEVGELVIPYLRRDI